MKTTLIGLLLVCLWLNQSHAQSSNSAKARKMYEASAKLLLDRKTTEAITSLNATISKYPEFGEAYLLLAKTYSEKGEPDKQLAILEKAIQQPTNSNKFIYLQLALACEKACMPERALEYYTICQSRFSQNDKRYGDIVTIGIKKATTAITLQTTPYNWHPQWLGELVNTPYDNYWPSVSLDGQTLIFTVNEITKGRGNEQFYTSEKCDTGWQQSQPLPGSINTTDNEGAQTISPDGRYLFFTACNRTDGYGSCDIYFAKRNGDGWSEPQPMPSPVNSHYWEGHPSVTPGMLFYFASERPDGHGGRDIYAAQLHEMADGTLTADNLRNLGDSINSPGNDEAPFIHPDGKTLCFSSNGWPGLGESDIFVSRRKSATEWQTPQNLGAPLNTCRNELGFCLTSDGTTGYYASRTKDSTMGKPRLQLFSVKMPQQFMPEPIGILTGRITDCRSEKPLQATILAEPLAAGSGSVTQSDQATGQFHMALPKQTFGITISRKGYVIKTLQTDSNMVQTINICLEPIAKGATITLPDVLFETASFQINPQAQPTIAQIAEFITENQNMLIEIAGHTDNTGSMGFNQKLSEQRAQALFAALIKIGVNPRQMTWKGYGSTSPVTDNTTETGRARNRRTEIVIMKAE